MNRIFVTGALGFVGRHLCAALAASGRFDITRCDSNKLCAGIPHCWNLDDDYDYVVHLAANIDSLDKRVSGGATEFIDAMLDYEMMRFLESHKPKIYIHMSSCVVSFPEPSDPYCAVKRFGEEMALHVCRKNNIPIVVFRPYSGYGTDQSPSYPFRAILDRAMRKEDPLTVWGSLDTIRDFIHIDDIVSAILHAIDGRMPFSTPIDLGTGVGTRMGDLARLMAQACGYDPQINAICAKPAGAPYRVMPPFAKFKWGDWYPKIRLEQGIEMAVGTHHATAIAKLPQPSLVQ